MRQVELVAQKRNVFGKGAARNLRRAGIIPGVLYGRDQDTMSVQINEQTFKKFLRANGENMLIDLNIDEYGTEPVLIKELQRHPVKRSLVHADFIRISLDESVTAPVPITLVGSPPGVQEGGVLTFLLRQISVTCLPLLIPEEIQVDISEMNIGDTIRVADLALDEEIENLEDPQSYIVSVVPPIVEAEPVEDVEEDEEGEEGEEGELVVEEASEPEEETDGE
ncbi:MAG: 50S ribosomal protein L25 [Candidatus Poribacteria bacterium]|nr:50S ribosomal protein L25 [Candidatus Poribacteria bacterium]